MKPEAIRAYRKKLDMTQAELGAALGVSGNTIARWERGEINPEAPEMIQLAFYGLELVQGIDRSGRIKELRQKVQENLRRAAEISSQW